MNRRQPGRAPTHAWRAGQCRSIRTGIQPSASPAAASPLARPAGCAAAATALLLGSCSYLDQRLTDLHDCFLYRWHEDALGLAAVAKLGPAEVALGGWYGEWGWGKDTWWQQPGYVLTCHGTGVPFTTLGPLAYGQSWSRLLATSSGGNHPGSPEAFDDVRSWLGISDVFDFDDGLPFRLTPQQRIADLFGVEVGVAPLFVSLHVGFNVAEFTDFVLGFVGIDIFADDGVPRPPTVPFLPVPPKAPGPTTGRR